MPAPFPGMDPYLEAPSGLPGVHHRLITAISDTLAARVRPAYSVRIEERVYITAPNDIPTRRQIAPDVALVHRRAAPVATAVETVTPPTLIEPQIPLVLHDRYLVIVDARSRKVVTTIEVLSSFNKTSGTQGRDAFLQKRRAVMESDAHWIEIDLLRAGERPLEIVGQSPYYALLKRSGTPGPYEVWFTGLRDSLPTIAIPLHAPAPDVPLSLQAVFDQVYERGSYADDLDYTLSPPLPPLPPDDAAWVAEQVRAWQTTRHSGDEPPRL